MCPRKGGNLNKQKKKPLEDRWRRYALAAGIVTIIGSLLYFEHIAVLYVLSTIALIWILLAVAFSDLEAVGQVEPEIDGPAVEIKESPRPEPLPAFSKEQA